MMETGSAMIAEWLFVEAVDDLRRRSTHLAERSRYELLGIAPLLRKLLLDGAASLVITVRRGHRDVPLEFPIRPWRPPATTAEHPELQWMLRLSGHELVGSPGDEPVRNIDAFLSTRVGIAGGEDLTVRDVILYYANVEGGVHHGHPREGNQRQETLSRIAPLLLGQTNSHVETLAYLAQVMVMGLTPLRESVLRAPLVVRGLHRPNHAGGYFEGHWTEEYRRSSAL
ncbi:hypothetical protein E3V93_13215 [Microbacterium sp. 3H14]|uniref:hypothetical protein n=1 Tax=unclassified Microbacterium TaxID=2609290 RepID=UPI00106BD24D|nr:hypothetical protein [Microbacterium sp. 3H14]TFB17514.1 hypothetical protein E3V93_13215 [Microbacterium sp. 3H14]